MPASRAASVVHSILAQPHTPSLPPGILLFRWEGPLGQPLPVPLPAASEHFPACLSGSCATRRSGCPACCCLPRALCPVNIYRCESVEFCRLMDRILSGAVLERALLYRSGHPRQACVSTMWTKTDGGTLAKHSLCGNQSSNNSLRSPGTVTPGLFPVLPPGWCPYVLLDSADCTKTDLKFCKYSQLKKGAS